MPVNLPLLDPAALLPVQGVTLQYAEAGIKKAGRKDVLLMTLAAETRVAGVFTRNRFCAAPVHVCREVLASGVSPRALIINTGNANAGTGQAGRDRALSVCAAVAEAVGCEVGQVLPFSTGVTLEPLPADKIVAALPTLRPASWAEAAEAIMTTDIQPKAASRTLTLGGKTVTLTGIAKGAGMIHPNMATMLGFIATDAAIAPALLTPLLQGVADVSFNSITVDGDTSTNDSFMLLVTGAAGNAEMTAADSADFADFRAALTSLAIELAQAIVRDGEGATKFMTIAVEAGRSVAECKAIAYAIAKSPLVKTAFFASDLIQGRFLVAIGYAGIDDLDVDVLDLYLDDVLVACCGGRNPDYREEDGQRVMNKPEILVRVVLNSGAAQATVWTCDFSYDYVRINADYRS